MIRKTPNPQGKGLSLISELRDAQRSLANCPAKPILQLANELFTSMFILHSQFKFKPVAGKDYWLYQKDRQFRLSLVSPDEWRHHGFGFPIACCQLHADMTWSLKLTKAALENDDFMQFIEKQRNEFDNKLNAMQQMSQLLPGFQSHLPFYQRAFVSALSYSLGVSMHKANIASLNYETAKKLAIE